MRTSGSLTLPGDASAQTMPLLAGSRERTTWVAPLGVYLAVLLLIPVNLYRLPVALPFDLEPQRVVLFGILALWCAALLVDPRVRLRETAVSGPGMLLFGAAVLSLVANVGSLTPDEGMAPFKALAVMASWLLLCIFAASAVPDFESAVKLSRWLVLLGVFLASWAVVERVTGFNIFAHVDDLIPFLESTGARRVLERGGGIRVSGSSEHSIAFGALLVLIVPFAAYMVEQSKSYGSRMMWAAASGLVGLAALMTGSRTAFLGLGLVAAVVFVARPRLRTAMVALGLAVLLAAYMLFPGLLGGFRHNLSAEHLVGHEFMNPDDGRGQAYPILAASVQERPLLGVGFRRYDPRENTFTDNQYLKQLAEMGVLGLIAFTWLVLTAAVQPWRASRRSSEVSGGIFVALAASCGAFAVMSLGYDTFGFPQASYLFFALAGVGCGLSMPILRGQRSRQHVGGDPWSM